MAELHHQEVNIGQYNLQVTRTMYNMRRMVTFHPKDVDRLQKILYPRVGLLRDLHCLPVWVIENLNRHPEELGGSQFEPLFKQNAFHLLTKADINLDAPTLDVVPNSTHCWVKKNEEIFREDNWEYGVKTIYKWQKRPGSRKRRRGENDNQDNNQNKELYWKLTIFRLSELFNINRYYSFDEIDPDRLGVWKLVMLSPTTRRRNLRAIRRQIYEEQAARAQAARAQAAQAQAAQAAAPVVEEAQEPATPEEHSAAPVVEAQEPASPEEHASPPQPQPQLQPQDEELVPDEAHDLRPGNF